MTIVIQHMRLHLVIVFQIYYLYIKIDPLSQYIWTLVVSHYVGINKILHYKILYYIIIDLLSSNQLIELIRRQI